MRSIITRLAAPLLQSKNVCYRRPVTAFSIISITFRGFICLVSRRYYVLEFCLVIWLNAFSTTDHQNIRRVVNSASDAIGLRSILRVVTCSRHVLLRGGGWRGNCPPPQLIFFPRHSPYTHATLTYLLC